MTDVELVEAGKAHGLNLTWEKLLAEAKKRRLRLVDLLAENVRQSVKERRATRP